MKAIKTCQLDNSRTKTGSYAYCKYFYNYK